MGSRGLAHRPSCSVALWDLPVPGLESTSPALAGRFLATGPLGKPLRVMLDSYPTSFRVSSQEAPLVSPAK